MSRLQRFWGWWWPSILSWLPSDARSQFHRPPMYQFLNWNGHELESSGHPEEQAVGSIIVLPARMALVRSLWLPLAAIRRLHDIAAFEVDRQTPFSAANAHFAAAPSNPIRRKGDLFEAQLAVVPNHIVESALEIARTSVPRLMGIDVAGVDGRPLGVNLLPVRERYQSPTKWRRWNGALIAICVIATFGILFSVMQARERALVDLERRFQPLQAQAEETRRREHQLGQIRTLSTGRSSESEPLALDLLSELSKRLPQGSHLLHTHLEGGVLSLRGRTKNLSGVLQGLGRSRLWDDPKLSGSRTLPDGLEQEFSLSLTLKVARVAKPQ
jgi:general secretion pathway protein L